MHGKDGEGSPDPRQGGDKVGMLLGRHGKAMLGDPNPTRFMTYGQLKEASAKWPSEVLDQYVQMAPPVINADTPVILMPVFALGPVGELLTNSEGVRVHASIRFPDGADDDLQMAIFTDWNPAAISAAVHEGVFDAIDDPGGAYSTDDLLEMVEGGLTAKGRSLYNIARRDAGYGCVIYYPEEGHESVEEGLRVSAYHPTMREALAAELRILATENDEELKRGGGSPMDPPPPRKVQSPGGLVLIDPPDED